MGEGDDLRSAETAPARTLAPVDLQTRFDQFPATIKGAFVLRGADGNPHAVDLIESTVDRIPSGPTRPVPVAQTRVEREKALAAIETWSAVDVEAMGTMSIGAARKAGAAPRM